MHTPWRDMPLDIPVDRGSLMPMTQHLMDMGRHNYLPHESPPCDHGFENNLVLLLGFNASVYIET
jgi:hypothetical protein